MIPQGYPLELQDSDGKWWMVVGWDNDSDYFGDSMVTFKLPALAVPKRGGGSPRPFYGRDVRAWRRPAQRVTE